MIKEALEYIVNLSAPHLEFRNGSHYADRALHRIPNELTASPLAVHTLSAVRDYIESGADECAEDEDSIGRRFVIHVADYDSVYLYRELNSNKAVSACWKPSCPHQRSRLAAGWAWRSSSSICRRISCRPKSATRWCSSLAR